MAFKAWLLNKSSVELRSQYSEARKVAAIKVELYKKRAWKEFGERFDDVLKIRMLVLLVLGTLHKYASRVAVRTVTHVDASRVRQDAVRNLGVLNTTRSAA